MSGITKEDIDGVFFNLSMLSKRLPLEEAKRLDMMVRVITGYIKELEEKVNGSETGNT